MDPVQPEDIAVLVALAAHQEWGEVRQQLLTCLPEERLTASVARLGKSRLCLPTAQRVARSTLVELLIHGVPFLFPPSFGEQGLGVPTAWSDPRVIAGMGLVVPAHQAVVWPLEDRRRSWVEEKRVLVEGQFLEPLAPWVSTLAVQDEPFHWLMSLAECLRAGRARERNWASQQLHLLWGRAA